MKDYANSDFNAIDEVELGHPIDLTDKTIDDLMEIYEDLLFTVYMKSHSDSKYDSIRKPGFVAMIDWLRSTDFYRAPASSVYHESFAGGLVTHHLKVYNEICELIKIPKFSSVDITSAALVALTHDWCKIYTYTSYKRNVKNDQTGQWEQVDSFKRDFKGLTLGHGATSMFLASRFFQLSAHEALAIRWHMGEYNVCEGEMNELHNGNAKVPLCYLIQFADRLACVNY